MTDLQFGIDLGGTKTEIMVLDSHGRVRFNQRVGTPADSYQAILDVICGLVHAAEHALGTKAQCLGLGAPGTPFGPQGRLKNANTTCLIGQPLAHDLQTALNLPVVVENDANCLVLSEATDGSGKGASVVFGVILGTGVGGGLAVNQNLINGPNRLTGEWGHNPLPLWSNRQPGLWPARACYCGKHDCIETYFSGKGLCQTYTQQNPNADRNISANLIAQAALHNDPAAVLALDCYYDALAPALTTMINVVDPDVIVFGGGLSQLPGLCSAIGDRLPQHVFGGDVHTRLRTATHGDASGVRGAAWLTKQLV